MKTEKFNDMIDIFDCDFSLAVQGKKSLAELDDLIEEKNEKLMRDIDLLAELSWLLRNGQAEIHLVE